MFVCSFFFLAVMRLLAALVVLVAAASIVAAQTACTKNTNSTTWLWSTTSQDGTNTMTTLAKGTDAPVGWRATRFNTSAGFEWRAHFTRAGTATFSISAATTNRFWFLIRGKNTNSPTWQINAPVVRFNDSGGRLATYTPTSQLLSDNGITWRRITIMLNTTSVSGFTVSIASGFLWTAIRQVSIVSDTWGAGFWVAIDSPVFDHSTSAPCNWACSCANGGVCDSSTYVCRCPLGWTGWNCSTCDTASGFVLVSGVCKLNGEPSPVPTVWPNSYSNKTSDTWIAYRHSQIQILKPKVLIVNFVNPTLGTTKAETLVNTIIRAFADGSRPRGNMTATARLQYQIAKFVNLRDGDPGFPAATTSWPYQNSHQMPRYPSTDTTHGWKFGYKDLYNTTYANWYGMGGKTLCQLVNDGTIHEMWLVLSGDVPDANAAEVLEWKQMYDDTNRKIAGSFSRCAANGCFDSDVPNCGRSFRIGVINYNRGPGCYLHSHGHGMETAGGLIPTWKAWWYNFLGFDWNTRYNLPFSNAYGISCTGPSGYCRGFPSATTCVFYNANTNITKTNFDSVCGNVHFMPNARGHYDDSNTQVVSSSCQNFGFGGALTGVSKSTWAIYGGSPYYYTDCSGEFLTWWYQRMPWWNSGQKYASGASMPAVGPYLWY